MFLRLMHSQAGYGIALLRCSVAMALLLAGVELLLGHDSAHAVFGACVAGSPLYGCGLTVGNGAGLVLLSIPLFLGLWVRPLAVLLLLAVLQGVLVLAEASLAPEMPQGLAVLGLSWAWAKVLGGLLSVALLALLVDGAGKLSLDTAVTEAIHNRQFIRL